MANYKLRGSAAVQLISTKTITDTDTTVTFDISEDISSITNSELLIVLNLSVNGALRLGLQINGVTGSTYHTDGISETGGTTTNINEGAVASWAIATALICTADTNTVHGEIHICIPTSGAARPNAISKMSGHAGVMQVLCHRETSPATLPITQLKFIVSTSSLEGGFISLYRIKAK